MKVRPIEGHQAGEGYWLFKPSVQPSVMFKSAACCAFSCAQSFTSSAKVASQLSAKDADDACHFILYRAMKWKCPIVFYLTEHQKPFYDFFMKCPYVTAKVSTPTKMSPAGSYAVTMFVVEVPEGSDKEVVQKQENQIGQGAKSWGTRYPSSFKVGI